VTVVPTAASGATTQETSQTNTEAVATVASTGRSAEEIFGPSPENIDYDSIEWSIVDFGTLSEEIYSKVIWNQVDFSEITPGSIAAESLDWGLVDYTALDSENFKSISRPAIDLSDLDLKDIRSIQKNPASEALFKFDNAPKAGTERYLGSDNKIDVIISGGKLRGSLKASGGEGTDLFLASKGKGSLIITDFTPGEDTATLNLKPQQLARLAIKDGGDAAQILYKKDLLFSFTGIDASTLSIDGSQII